MNISKEVDKGLKRFKTKQNKKHFRLQKQVDSILREKGYGNKDSECKTVSTKG